MFLITAVIQPSRLDAVRDALRSVGAAGMTISEVQGFGRQRGHTATYRGAEYRVSFVRKQKVEVLVEDHARDEVVEAIAAAARTEKVGDGKIWVMPIGSLLRIRTGESGPDAV